MIKILHLYHDLLNLYGEYGNLVVLCDNLSNNGIEFKVDKLSIDDEINFIEYDFIYCGSGTESKTDLAYNDLIKRKDSFIKAFESGKYFLFTGSSLMLLGKTYNGNVSLNIFNFDSIKSNQRINGDVIISSKDFKDVVGFINTSYCINEKEKKYFDYIGSDNDLKKYIGLGFMKKNLLSVNVTGPLLIKNPNILEYYVKKLGKLYNPNFVYTNKIKRNQLECYKVTLNELKNRFSVK